MQYYREKEHILHLPCQARLRALNVLQSITSDIFTESKVPPISKHQLDSLVNKLKKTFWKSTLGSRRTLNPV